MAESVLQAHSHSHSMNEASKNKKQDYVTTEGHSRQSVKVPARRLGGACGASPDPRPQTPAPGHVTPEPACTCKRPRGRRCLRPTPSHTYIVCRRRRGHHLPTSYGRDQLASPLGVGGPEVAVHLVGAGWQARLSAKCRALGAPAAADTDREKEPCLLCQPLHAPPTGLHRAG